MSDLASPDLERITVYIRFDQLAALEELRMKLRQQGVKTNKSAIVRVALDKLVEEGMEKLKERLGE